MEKEKDSFSLSALLPWTLRAVVLLYLALPKMPSLHRFLCHFPSFTIPCSTTPTLVPCQSMHLSSTSSHNPINYSPRALKDRHSHKLGHPVTIAPVLSIFYSSLYRILFFPSPPNRQWSWSILTSHHIYFLVFLKSAHSSQSLLPSIPLAPFFLSYSVARIVTGTLVSHPYYIPRIHSICLQDSGPDDIKVHEAKRYLLHPSRLPGEPGDCSYKKPCTVLYIL